MACNKDIRNARARVPEQLTHYIKELNATDVGGEVVSFPDSLMYCTEALQYSIAIMLT